MGHPSLQTRTKLYAISMSETTGLFFSSNIANHYHTHIYMSDTSRCWPRGPGTITMLVRVVPSYCVSMGTETGEFDSTKVLVCVFEVLL
jgi:hypothetical protein